MVRTLLKSSLREIRRSLGRYLAILAIVGLGVGFFAGLRGSQPAMMATGVDYLARQRLYDFRLLSTLGFTREDVDRFAALEGVEAARGAVYTDFLVQLEDGEEHVFRAHSLTEGVNLPSLKAGRMPEAPDECLADARYFGEDALGGVFAVSDSNDEDTRELLHCGAYTIVGVAWSPYYLNYERGTSSLGSGSVAGFVYIPEDGFDFEAYYEIYLTLEEQPDAYSDAYDQRIDGLKPAVEALSEERADLRYETLYADALEELQDGEREVADGWDTYRSERSDADGELADAYRELTDGEREYRQALEDYEQGRRDYADGQREYADALQKLADAEAELADGEAELADGEEKLADAEREIADGQRELEDARRELDEGWADYNEGKADAEAELAEAYEKLTDGEREYADGLTEYEDGAAQLDEARAELEEGARTLQDSSLQLGDAQRALDAAWTELQAGQQQLEESAVQLDAARTQLEQGEEEYKAGYQLLEQTAQQMGVPVEVLLATPQGAALTAARAELDRGWETYRSGLAQYEAGLAEYEAGSEAYWANAKQVEAAQRQLDQGWQELAEGRQEIADAQAELDEARAALEEAREELDQGWSDYNEGRADADAELAEAYEKLTDGEAEYAEGLAELDDGRRELEDARAELAEAREKRADGRRELADGKAELADAGRELRDARKELERAPGELADAREELDDGWREYNDGRAEADEEFADAERELREAEEELADAREKLADLKTASTYVLTREENTGYACFRSDTSIIEAISVVFPVFFFLVAALVCMTTMKRMVDEQRTQIGVLKALGYGNGQIMGKYLFYSGSAALIGSTAGYALGANGLPWIFWEIYGIIYGFAPLKRVVLPGLLLLSVGAALLCSLGATWLSCRVELSRQAAELIRPKAPRAGRRVFLEYITPLWRRLSFLYKVSARNVLRYRSRLVMMVLGIGGCTALLATGFGVRDSIKHVADDQFEEITLYDYAVSFQEAQTQASAEAYLARCGWSAEEGLLVHSGSVDVLTEAGSKSVYLVVSSTGSVEGFLDLHSGEEPVPYPGPGEAVVNVGLAENLGIAQGDAIQLRDGDLGTLDVTVSAIADNYVFNYVYVAPETYRQQLGQVPEYNALYVLGHQEADPYGEGAVLLEDDDAGSVAVNQATREQVDNMLSRLDYVVAVVVLCAGALAFIVLYNLTNINITERVREIATIKVLGFQQNEVAAYVFREINILSLLGSLAGLPMGKWLHAFVMEQIQIDSVFFACRITPLSYLLSLGMTMLFTLAISLGMRPRLRRIDMAESLKSIE